jgi:hypothetical protein
MVLKREGGTRPSGAEQDQGLPRVMRSLMLADGRVKTSFEDGTWIVLEPTGSCYTYFDPKVNVLAKERCLTQFSRHKQQGKLALALDFRNAHSPYPPYWCRAIEKLGKRTWTSEIRIERTSWDIPTDLQYDDAEDSLKLKSKDGRCLFELMANKLRFSICFPVLFETNQRRNEEGEGPVHSYYLQLQHFSTRDCPPRWRSLLEAVQDQLGCEPQKRKAKVFVTDLPQASTSEKAEWIPTDEQSFWESHKDIAYPRDTTVAVEWTPNCLLRFIRDLGEAEVLIFFNQSLMVSQNNGKEFQHFLAGSADLRGTGDPRFVYRPANLMSKKKTRAVVNLDKITNNKSESIFEFYNMLVEYGSKFLEHAMLVNQVLSHKEYNTRSKGAPHVSNEIFFQNFHPEIGKMIAFEDRRVWVKFIDKTFLEMDHDHSYCKLTLPRGDVRIVSVHKPVGVEDYVQMAHEFASWVFQTPNERDKQIQLYSTIHAQVEASKRMSKVIDWHLGTNNISLLS